MNVAMIQVDGKYANLALMKLAAHHLAQGDTVTVDPLPMEVLLGGFDRAYQAKVFTFTPDWGYVPDCEVVKGGTGYGDPRQLPHDVEHTRPAYDLFGCDFSMGFTTRGCPRACPWCVVPKKEGQPKVVADLDEFVDPKHRQVRLLDANLTAPTLHDHFTDLLGQLITRRLQVDFCQGLDARLLQPDHAVLLSRVRYWKPLHVAWDAMDGEDGFRRGMTRLKNAGMNLRDVVVYVLVGHSTTPEQDVYRVQAVRDLGATPYVMAYEKMVAKGPWRAYLNAVCRWGQRPELRNVAWMDYAYGQWITKRDWPLVKDLLPG